MTFSKLPRLPPRKKDAHKGDFGRALLVGGSKGMAGAIALAGMACLRGGAGLVRLAVPEPILDTVAGFEPSYMTLPLPADGAGRIAQSAGEFLLSHFSSCDCVACGPGLSRSDELTALVRGWFTSVPKPMVLDADGLFPLAPQYGGLVRATYPRVLTPHPGEFARLCGMPPDARPSREEQVAAAVQLAERFDLVILLKGHHTVITDGRRTVENQTGNPGMATGGSGDVLTGLITALICQGLPAWEAAVLAAHLHGLAGDLAAAELTEVSLIASDLVRYLPKALRLGL
jgi:NAD(P)H-hydrate epimerase